MSHRDLIFIELNEINFDLVRLYLDKYRDRFPALRTLLSQHSTITSAEGEYEKLEPWVQWPSVHTGLSFKEHQIFRLGDVVESNIPQFFELLEQAGYSVGAVSPINAANRLRAPAYFIPDPWTRTAPDRSKWSEALARAMAQTVNENATARISARSALTLLAALLRFSRCSNWPSYVRLATTSTRAPWRRALFLDLFLSDLHLSLFKSRRPNFSVLFLNAGAHIQHHYLLNAQVLADSALPRNPAWYVGQHVDPFAEMLTVYDRLLSDHLRVRDAELVVATGLSQRPYDRAKFYYRLRDHAEFLKVLGVEFETVLPRMTRDFLVTFADERLALQAEDVLRAVTVGVGGAALFGELDNRGCSLFVTLTYPEQIDDKVVFTAGGVSRPLKPFVAFVAVKNGMHQGRGFAFFSKGVAASAPADGAHVKELYRTVLDYFGAGSAGIDFREEGGDTAVH